MKFALEFCCEPMSEIYFSRFRFVADEKLYRCEMCVNRFFTAAELQKHFDKLHDLMTASCMYVWVL